VQQIIDRLGGLKKAAKKSQISPRTLAYYAEGREASLSYLLRLASAAGVTVSWLIGESNSELGESGSVCAELLNIPVIDVSGGAEATWNANGERIECINERFCLLPRVWLESETNRPGEALAVFYVDDNDNHPFLSRGDTAIVDRYHVRLVNEIMLVLFEDRVFLTSVRWLGARKIELYARNAGRPSIIVDDPARVRVLGCVVGVWHPVPTSRAIRPASYRK
jgi:transcriptional regulator with XRE-family HTH domain